MKKIFYFLLIACAMIACGKDDGNPEPQPQPNEPMAEQNNNIVPLSTLLSTAWSETNWFEFKYYDSNGNFIEEVDYNGDRIVGPTYSLYLSKDYIGWWIPTGLNGGHDQPYTYGTTSYEFSQEEGVLKIGDIECDLHNFTADHIELTCTVHAYDDKYCVKRIRLTPIAQNKTWDEWVEMFDAENTAWEANK
ncbi:MAG: hypothetical protein J6Q29_02455 [Alistipes sp.]|nr:hypothetical protein [Alistipes sp.]